MKGKNILLITTALGLTFGAFFATAPSAEATHFRYGNLSWESVDPDEGEVIFHLTMAFRRGYPGSHPDDGQAMTGDIIRETIGGTGLDFGDGTSTSTLDFLVTGYSITEDWVFAVALDPDTDEPGIRKTYSGEGPYVAVSQTCCRIGALNNRSSGNYSLETTVDPMAGHSSPVSNLIPIVAVAESENATFLVPANDAYGDHLTFRFATDSEAGGGPNPPNMAIDEETGTVTWDNVGLDQNNPWTTQVVIESREANGDLITQTAVDFFLRIIDSPIDPPEISFDSETGETSIPESMPSGRRVERDITVQSADGGEVTLNAVGLPSGATMDPPLPLTGDGTVSSRFSWRPRTNQIGPHVVTFSVTDQYGAQTLESASITVNPPTTDEFFAVEDTGFERGTWIESPWLGRLYVDGNFDHDEAAGWVFHEQHGWLYYWRNLGWFWRHSQQIWTFMAEEFYENSWVYAHGIGWVFYYNENFSDDAVAPIYPERQWIHGYAFSGDAAKWVRWYHPTNSSEFALSEETLSQEISNVNNTPVQILIDSGSGISILELSSNGQVTLVDSNPQLTGQYEYEQDQPNQATLTISDLDLLGTGDDPIEIHLDYLSASDGIWESDDASQSGRFLWR